MLTYILDTNICIYITKKKPLEVFDKFSTLLPGSIGMSIITHAELKFGALKSQNSTLACEKLEQLIEIIPVVELQEQTAHHYADIRNNLESIGKPIGNNDLWIASHVRAMNKILVSNNLKEFNRVKGLKLENWVK